MGVEALGIIAGNRSLPLLLAKEARRQGVRRLVAVGYIGETDPELEHLVDEMVWLRVGQLTRTILALKSRGIRQCVMVGQLAPKNLFQMRPDLRAMTLLLRLRHKHAHSIFGAVANELAKEGIELIEPTPWLRPHMPGKDFHLGPNLKPTERADLEVGYRVAKRIAELEIGQTVVVKDGVVLAVEAFEGTDRCLERGGELAGPKSGAVAVKVAKEGHDMRFDIPCFGISTVETCARAGIRVLGVERDRTLFLDEEQVRQAVRRLKVTIVTVPVED